MATARAAGKARTRRRFLDAAARLFAERGFHAVSIGDLGTAVGVSGPALYRHFASKEAILEEILVGTSEYLLQGLREILDVPHESDAELLRLFVDFHTEFALTHREVIRVQDRELGTLPEVANRRVRMLQRQYLNLWVEVLSRLRPDVPIPHLGIVMHAVFGILNSTSHTTEVVPSDDVRAILSAASLRVMTGD